MAHDFRRIYGYSVFDVGTKIEWNEALLHLAMLKSTPESLLYVALSEGEVIRPWTWDEVAVYDLLDVTIRANSGKKSVKPVPRPWKSGKKKLGKGSVSFDIALNIFGRLGHKPKFETTT